VAGFLGAIASRAAFLLAHSSQPAVPFVRD